MSGNRGNFNRKRQPEPGEAELSARIRRNARKEWREIHGQRVLVTVFPCVSDMIERPPLYTCRACQGFTRNPEERCARCVREGRGVKS